MKKDELKNKDIRKISDFVNEQGTLVQEDFFEQIPVHHINRGMCAINNDVIIYIGKEAVFNKKGVKYNYIDLPISEIKNIVNMLSI